MTDSISSFGAVTPRFISARGAWIVVRGRVRIDGFDGLRGLRGLRGIGGFSVIGRFVFRSIPLASLSSARLSEDSSKGIARAEDCSAEAVDKRRRSVLVISCGILGVSGIADESLGRRTGAVDWRMGTDNPSDAPFGRS